MEPISFADLPYDVILSILGFLPEKERICMRAVSIHIRDCVDYITPTIQFHFQKQCIYEALFKQCMNIFLTGSAGTGKTTMLNWVIKQSEAQGLKVQTLTPTHMARQLFGESCSTIHAFAHLNHSKSIELLAERISKPPIPKVDLLIIDEVSMVGSKLLDCLDYQLRRAWKSDLPMGGVKVIMCGDFLQLPPIQDSMIFKSTVWNKLSMKQINLRVPLRQGKDLRWFDHLQSIRLGESCPSLFNHLEKYQQIEKDAIIDVLLNGSTVFLSSTNKEVEDINLLCFNLKSGEEIKYNAQDRFLRKERGQWIDSTPPPSFKSDVYWRAPSTVPLKVGMHYLCTANITKSIFNGRLLIYKGNDILEAPATSNLKTRNVKLSQLWFKFTFPLSCGLLLVRHQFALRLGYAVTIHKSQGMTLPRVIVNMKGLKSNMLYVAFSRVRCRDDLLVYNFPKNFTTPKVSQDALSVYTKIKEEKKKRKIDFVTGNQGKRIVIDLT